MRKRMIPVCILLALMLVLQSAAVFAEPEDGDTTEELPAEEPVYEEPAEDPYAEDPTYEEPAEDPYAEDPSYEEPAEDPYAEEPAYEEPVEDPYAEEPVYEEPAEDPYAEEPVYEEPAEDPYGSEPAEEPAEEPEEPEEPASDGSPSVKAGGAIVYCRNIGSVIWSSNPDKKFAPYGITKVLTALLAVQRLDPDQTVTVSAAAAEASSGSKMDLKEGETLTVEQLLYGALLLSDNGASLALAEAVSGDEDSFVELMNETVANIGCKNTQFANAAGSGNDVSEQYTTAADMLEICKVFFANSLLRKIAGTAHYEMKATNLSDIRTIDNPIPVLAEGGSGYVAGKTGYWTSNTTSLVMNYNDNGLDLITVVLDASSSARYKGSDAMVEYAAANIEGITVFKKGDVAGKARVKHGAESRVDAVAAENGLAYLPQEGSKELITTQAVMDPDLTAPVKEGDVVGKYQILIGGEVANEVDLVAAADVAVGWIPSYLGISNRAAIIIGAVLALVLLLLIVRTVNKARMRHRRKKARRLRAEAMAREQLLREQQEMEERRRRTEIRHWQPPTR